MLKILTDEVGSKSKYGNHYTLIEDAESDTARENAFLWVSGLALHNISLSLFYTESKGRKRVGNQVNEKDMNRLKYRKSKHGSKENADNFREVGRGRN